MCSRGRPKLRPAFAPSCAPRSAARCAAMLAAQNCSQNSSQAKPAMLTNAVVRKLAYGRSHRRVWVVCPPISWSAHSKFFRSAAVGASSNAISGERPQPRETCVTFEQIQRYDTDLKNVRRAQRILRDLGSHLLAFGESETAACIAIKPFGFDP